MDNRITRRGGGLGRELRRLRARPAVAALAVAWLGLVLGLSLLAARQAIAAEDDCAVELLSRAFHACLVRR